MSKSFLFRSQSGVAECVSPFSGPPQRRRRRNAIVGRRGSRTLPGARCCPQQSPSAERLFFLNVVALYCACPRGVAAAAARKRFLTPSVAAGPATIGNARRKLAKGYEKSLKRFRACIRDRLRPRFWRRKCSFTVKLEGGVFHLACSTIRRQAERSGNKEARATPRDQRSPSGAPTKTATWQHLIYLA